MGQALHGFDEGLFPCVTGDNDRGRTADSFNNQAIRARRSEGREIQLVNIRQRVIAFRRTFGIGVEGRPSFDGADINRAFVFDVDQSKRKIGRVGMCLTSSSG